MAKHLGDQELHDLMPRERSGDHEHLAVAELVPASIFRRPLQIGEADSRPHDLHTRHGTPSPSIAILLPASKAPISVPTLVTECGSCIGWRTSLWQDLPRTPTPANPP